LSGIALLTLSEDADVDVSDCKLNKISQFSLSYIYIHSLIHRETIFYCAVLIQYSQTSEF